MRSRPISHPRVPALPLLVCLVGAGCAASAPAPPTPVAEPARLTLAIRNGEPAGPLDLVADQEYTFHRITLEVDNRAVRSSTEALAWLSRESSFRTLDWSGVRETHAHWRNFKASRPAADLFSHVFDRAAWMRDANSLDIAVLDGTGAVIGSPLHLSNDDFLNRITQWDFDLVKAEYRYENFERHKQKDSARTKRAVAKIAFVLQTNAVKRLRVPSGARALRIVWDKKPQEPYVFPVRLVASPYAYGLRIVGRVEPRKDVYQPGETLRATFSLQDSRGQTLKLSDFEKNGVTRLYAHLEGPRHRPRLYHEEWLNDFRGNRFEYHLNAPAELTSTEQKALAGPRPGPSLSADGTELVVDLHVPANLPPDSLGTFEVLTTAGRTFLGEAIEMRWEQPIQVGQREPTTFETFGCPSCHVPDTPTELGLLIPPMVGTEKLRVEDLQRCVMCHDNSRGGSRRLDKYLHLIHMNRDTFPAKRNDCTACHTRSASIRTVAFEVCSTCHEHLHADNRPAYTDGQCLACHADDRGHIVPRAADAPPSRIP